MLKEYVGNEGGFNPVDVTGNLAVNVSAYDTKERKLNICDGNSDTVAIGT